MTENTERLPATCSYCGHRYTYPAHIEEKAVMRCPQCREYIHVRTGAPLGQSSEPQPLTSAPAIEQPAVAPPAAPAAGIGEPALPARHQSDGSPERNGPPAERTPHHPPSPQPPSSLLLALAGILLSAIWLFISPDDRETYVYDAKDGSFAICWPYIRWSITALLCLPCLLAAVILRAIKNAETR